MPCGCIATCGCSVNAGAGLTSLTVGDTITLNLVLADTECIALTTSGGALVAEPIIDPAPTSVELSCGADGLTADVVLDPASTGASVGPDGLLIDASNGFSIYQIWFHGA